MMKYLYLGKIVNTHGIKGEIRILSNFKYKSKVLKKHFKVYIGKTKQEETINSYRPHKQFDMITLEGITNINDVLKYKGSSIFINRNDLILESGEYLDEDLIGMSVLMNQKNCGTIVRIQQDRYQDKIVVNKEEKEYLVPYVYDIIKEINIKEKTITLEPIKGLLDDWGKKMKIDILTLFPDMFSGFLNDSIIKRAREKKLVEINVHNFRDYSPFKNKQVDDYSYGGGAGMVLMCEPIFLAIEDLKTENSEVIMLTPSGKTFNQQTAQDFSQKKHLILLCGHYEGFDERIKTIVDYELSIGDFVLTGGEVPAMAVVDAITRLIPGVINEESLQNETFNDDMVDYPVYTKPADFRGLKVPEVLLSGHHANIDKWRQEERKRLTNLRKE